MPSDLGLGLTLRVVPGTLTVNAGGEIAFERGILELRNDGAEVAGELRLTLEALQGPDVICRLDEALEGDLAPGAVRAWDLYELFLEKGRGLPSKVHLFGVKAVLGWDFTVHASVGSARAAFRLRWSEIPSGPITADVEELR